MTLLAIPSEMYPSRADTFGRVVGFFKGAGGQVKLNVFAVFRLEVFVAELGAAGRRILVFRRLGMFQAYFFGSATYWLY